MSMARAKAMAGLSLKPTEKPNPKLAAQAEKYVIPIGKRFGEWQVIGQPVLRTRTRKHRGKTANKIEAFIPCRCSCGYETTVRYYGLLCDESRQCKHCALKKNSVEKQITVVEPES